jgi:fumarate reductase iron-sulfur subunit
MGIRQLELEVMRYDPEKDEAPWFQSYTVPCNEDWVILDAINYIKDNLDTTLAYRWSCHMMVCGSCGMMINGEPSLTCKTFVRDMPDKVRVEPMENFPIERDLVVVLDDVIEKLHRVKPYIVRKDDPPPEDQEYIQSRGALAKFKQLTMCINCMLCYAACPQYGLDKSFIGPAALAMAQRYNKDSRDQGKSIRLDLLGEHDGVWECSFVGACSEVCPKHVDPAAAIQQMKVDTAIEFWKQRMGIPGGKS